MKNIKKLSFISILFVAAILLSNLISCKKNPASEKENEPDIKNASEEIFEPYETTESAEEIRDAIPEIDFGGKTFNILVPDQWYGGTTHMIQEEITGEPVNDAQYLLKSKIDERFNVELKETVTDNIWGTDYISKFILSGDDRFDIYFVMDIFVIDYARNKMVYNWNELVYIDLTKPYWDSNTNKSVTINSNMYFAFGAYDLSYYDFTDILVFNKDMIQDYGLETPYDLVKSGKWTIDKFREMAKQATADVNGDGKMDINDSYGYINVPKQILPSFWIAAGELSVAKNADDYPYFNVPGNSRFYVVVDKIYEIMWDENIWCRNDRLENLWPESKKLFSDNRALFAAQTFYFLNEFRDIDTNFGIIPYPKFTEDQLQYYARVQGGSKMPIVPVTNLSPDKAGAILEAMACESYKTVIPQYYEVSLKRKNARDSESEEMLDLIFSNRVYDLGDTWWCNDFRDGLLRPMFTDNNRNLVSEIEKFEPKMNAIIDNLMQDFAD